MAYITVADLLDRFDVRTVCEFASDDEDGVPLSPGALATDSKVIAALDDASAKVDAALQYGRRYERSILTALVTNADRQKGSLIRRVVADLTMAGLLSRRLAPADDMARLIPTLAESREWLGRLHNGDAVLDYDPALDATLPQATGPNAIDFNRPTYWNQMFGVWPGGYC